MYSSLPSVRPKSLPLLLWGEARESGGGWRPKKGNQSSQELPKILVITYTNISLHPILLRLIRLTHHLFLWDFIFSSQDSRQKFKPISVKTNIAQMHLTAVIFGMHCSVLWPDQRKAGDLLLMLWNNMGRSSAHVLLENQLTAFRLALANC